MKGRFRKISVINAIAKSSIGKRITSVALAATILVTGVPFTPFEGLIDFSTMTASAANADNNNTVYDDVLDKSWYSTSTQTATINSPDNFVKYTQAYHSHPEKHYQDTIVFAVQGNMPEMPDFIGLGTSLYPFEGTIRLNSGSSNLFKIPEAFFDHISDKAVIENESGTAVALRIARTGSNGSGEPIFAKHVHHYSDTENNIEGAASWSIEICSYEETIQNETEERNYDFAGVFGEMQKGSVVQISLTDNTSANIYANSVTGDVGYICGTIKEGAKLSINSVTGSNSSYSITANNGNAGGIVGSMENGSTLTLDCSMLNSTPIVSATANGMYSGGLVGKNDGGTVTYTTAKPYTVGGTISGKAGAGGLFGFFRPAYTETMVDNTPVYTYTYDISDYTVSTTVNGNGSVGGLFGVFHNKRYVSESEGNVTYGDGNVIIKTTDNNKSNVSITHTSGDVHNIGGYIGYYTSKSMSSTLKFDNVKSTMTRSGDKFTYSYGGAIGRIATTSYVLFDGFELTKATNPTGEDGSVFGGLVGDAANSFIDTNAISGRSVKISSGSFKGGGIVGRFEDGVLRLRGATDISGTTCAGDGQIVGSRDDTLIFAESGWSLTRKGTPEEYDDIGSWGEVIRFGTDLTQSSVLTVGSDNLITIAAPVTTIDSEEDFAIDHICFSIKVGNTNVAAEGEAASYDGNPWLKYATGATLNHSNIVNTALELDAKIDLRKTGLTGLTRDSGTDKVTYSAAFDGNGHTITLAIGDTSTGFNGNIYRHDKNGLFGILCGGSITETEFVGAVNVKAYSDMCVGAAAAQTTGDFSATDVNVGTVFNANGASNIILGRLAGSVTADGASATNFSITNNSGYGDYTGNISGANSGESSCIGGVIGKISSSVNSAKTWTISNINLTTVANDSNHSGKIENTSSKDNQQIGGLVAVISNTNANKVTLTLADVDLNGVKLNEDATKSAGGLLGYKWTNTNVNVNSVTVTDGKITLSGSGADLGGIIYNASGKWTIPANGLAMDGTVVDAQGAGSFGMIVNHGGALYMLLTATNSFDCDGADLDDLNDDIVFDELVAYSVNYGTGSNGEKLYADEDGDPYILKNGNGIVSIKTSNLNMSGSGASGTYQPQTSYESYQNKWTRYYYNLDTITGATSPDASQKLMLWGLNKYAHKDLKTFFSASNTFNSDSNVYDMTGYSWYPVDVNSNVTIKGTFKFANDWFETCETANNLNASDSDKSSTSKSSLDQTQHYMMHEGLFRNVTDATVTVGNTTWQGTISRLNTPYKTNEYGTGALIFDTINGSKKTTAKVDSSSGKIILDGIKVCNANLSANGAYAPLLINKIGDYTKLTIKHIWVKNTGTASALDCNYNSNGSTIHAATSLIGNAGLSDSASNINFEFDNIKLDGRSGSAPSTLDSVYPTKRSIFTKATLLNQFMYASDSDATYNYSYSEDWADSSNHATGDTNGVTYGSELSDSTGHNQWYGEEFWYNTETHNASGKLTSPESGSLTGGAANKYNFSGFIPYVADASTKANLSTEKKHQIRVNHSSAKLTGCGTYNDPYMITQGDLEKIAKVINGGDLTAATFNLPILKHDVEGVLTAYENGTDLSSAKWDDYGDQPYKYNGTVFKTFTGDENNPTYTGTGYSAQEVRTYLAGAYYKLNSNIEISTGFTGLGATSDSYAVFRGVIIGSGEGKNTITNKSAKPLIASSHGSVVKNLNIIVDNTTIAPSKSNMDAYVSSQSDEAYGAVIGLILGGDNIIDNVKVQYNETTEDAETGDKTVTAKGIITVGGTNSYLVPVGGYAGVVVNGALIFRGMEEYRSLEVDMNISGLTNANVTDSSNTNNMLDSTKYLYVNPIVGRVLNGYVLTETSTYRPYETGTRTFPDTSTDSVGGAVTMKNGTKNYSIPDISTSDTSSIIVGSYSSAKSGTDYQKAKVTLLDGQGVYLFGALIQSQATKNVPAAPDMLVSSVSYGSYKTTHVGTYERIGEQNAAGTVAPASGHPYNDAVNDGWGTSAKPYIAEKYTSGGVLAVTNSNSICNIQLGSDSQSAATTFKVPDGFKGLGGYLSNDNNLSLFEFNGQNNIISMDSKLQYYRKQVVYNKAKTSDSANSAIDNYLPALFGFGFFNCLRQNIPSSGFDGTDTQTKDAYRIHDVTLSGSIKAQVYQTNGSISGYDFGSGQRDNHLSIVCVGGLCGLAGNGNKDKICINKVHLNNLSVFGAKTVGGLIGYINTNTQNQYVYECDADKLKVEAGQEAGGIVGVVANTNFYLDGKVSSSKNVAVKLISVSILSNLTGGDGGDSDVANNAGRGFNTPKNRAFYAGGVIGRSVNVITINDIDVGVLASDYSGFIGNIDRSIDTLNELSKDGDEYNGYSFYKGEKRYYNSSDKPWSIIGGVIGAVSSNGKALTVTNCNVYNISMYGGFGGGIAGRPEGAAAIYNCSVSSTQTTEQMEATETTTGKSSYMITGWYSVGGLVGEARAANTFDGCNVSNYVIRCYSEENDCNNAQTGGLTGRSKSGAAYIRNCSVVNCYLEGRGKSSGDNDTHEGIGGLVGINDEAINGYNILIKDIKLLANNTSVMDTSSSTPFAYTEINTSDNKRQNGYVCGASTSGKILKIIGFSLQVTDSTNNTISDPWYSTAKPDEANSYFINADYNCACDSEDTRSVKFSNIGLANADPKNNVKDFVNNVTMTNNKSYVTSSPFTYINSEQFLTGDGIYGSGYSNSIAKQIVEDAIGVKPTGYYQDIKLSFPYSISKESPGSYALDSKPSGTALTAMMAAFPDLYKDENGPLAEGDYPYYGDIYLSELQSKLTTFQTATEHGTSVPSDYDFPVLVLDDTNRYATTELLNNYIRVLTNTEYNYASTSNSSIYVVRFGKCTYQTTGANAGMFDVSWSTSSNNPSNLKIKDEYFSLSGEYDNEVAAGQFTLVDVQFKIPANINSTTNYIAYHLYIPVLVKKMLKFDFECSSLSGTTYRVDPYVDAPRNNVLIENLETPVTLQFSWVYRRTLEEWVKQIEGGDNLLDTFDIKKLLVEENNRAVSNVSGLGFPDADMVLVDASNYNKPYYATKAMAYSSGTLDLAKFTSDGTPSGTAFSSIDFNDFFDIEIVSDVGDNVVKCYDLGTTKTSAARIYHNGHYYRPYSDDDTGGAVYLKFAFRDGVFNTYGEGEDAYSYLKEDYYISFFTHKVSENNGTSIADDTSIYHLVFSSPKSLDNSVPNDINGDSGESDIFLGNIYSNVFSMTENASSLAYELNTGSSSIGATFKADIKLQDTAKSIVSGYVGLDSVRIYQSFLINFDQTYFETNRIKTEKGIKSEPNVSISSYIIDADNISGKRDEVSTSDITGDPICSISVDNGTVTGNYIELRNNVNLKDYLKAAYDKNSSNTSPIKIQVAFSLNYSGKDEEDTKQKITSQFPLRDETATFPDGYSVNDIGASLLGSSNISPSNTATAYSKTVDDGEGKTLYYTGLKTGGALTYNSDDNSNMYGTYAQLGINAWNCSDKEFPMKTLVTYNTKNIDKAETADKMELTITLYPKMYYNTPGHELKIGRYINNDNEKLKDYKKAPSSYVDNPNDVGNNLTEYLYTINNPRTVMKYDDETYSIPIDFSVFTGANGGFESATNETKYYSNYMVKVEIKLYAGATLLSTDSDYLIYSNAKIYSDWITTP